MSSSRFASLALALLLLPFVTAFDFPDTTGVRAKISAGRGTYSISSCSRSYRSEYFEGNFDVRSTFETGSDEPKLAKKLQPGKTTVGAYGNWVQEELRLIANDGVTLAEAATPIDDWGQSYGVYTQMDWRHFGLQVGALYLSRWEPDLGIHESDLFPTAEVRLGQEFLFASAGMFPSTPVFSGGGGFQGGVGGRKGNTRIWGGYSIFPVRENSITLKLSQKAGPVTLGFSGQWSPEASNYDAVHENGFSLGLDFPLSKAW